MRLSHFRILLWCVVVLFSPRVSGGEAPSSGAIALEDLVREASAVYWCRWDTSDGNVHRIVEEVWRCDSDPDAVASINTDLSAKRQRKAPQMQTAPDHVIVFQFSPRYLLPNDRILTEYDVPVFGTYAAPYGVTPAKIKISVVAQSWNPAGPIGVVPGSIGPEQRGRAISPKPNGSFRPDASEPHGVSGGEAVVEFVVTKKGDVTDVRLIRATDEASGEAAIARVKRNRFKPGSWNGTPVDWRLRIPVVFTIQD